MSATWPPSFSGTPRLDIQTQFYRCRLAKGDESAALAAKCQRTWASSVCVLSRQCHDSFLPRLPNSTVLYSLSVTPFPFGELVINIPDPNLFELYVCRPAW